MQKILITGASGFIGAYLCRKLSKRRTPGVTALYNTNPSGYPHIKYLQCDMTDLIKLTDIFTETKPDIVYHLASVTPTRTGSNGNDYVEYFNHFITGHVAKLAEENNALMIYTSTDLVYREGENLTEDSILDPKTVYAESKLNGEDVIMSLSKKYFILRMSLVYGLTLNNYESFFDYAYKTLRGGKELKAFGDLYRKPIYVKDVVLNFCGEEYFSRYDMCLKMAKVYGFNEKLVQKIGCEEHSGGPWVKKLNLNNQLMHYYGLSTSDYETNLRKSLKHRY
jgi:dTDP-4-dehydrorhamnose reductase